MLDQFSVCALHLLYFTHMPSQQADSWWQMHTQVLVWGDMINMLIPWGEKKKRKWIHRITHEKSKNYTQNTITKGPWPLLQIQVDCKSRKRNAVHDCNMSNMKHASYIRICTVTIPTDCLHIAIPTACLHRYNTNFITITIECLHNYNTNLITIPIECLHS